MTKEKKLNGKPENKSNESETEDQTTSETDDKEPLLPTQKDTRPDNERDGKRRDISMYLADVILQTQ